MASETSTRMHVLLLESLHMTCLKNPPPAGGFATIGCRLSRARIPVFVSIAETSSSIVSPYTLNKNNCTFVGLFRGNMFHRSEWNRSNRYTYIIRSFYSLFFGILCEFNIILTDAIFAVLHACMLKL